MDAHAQTDTHKDTNVGDSVGRSSVLEQKVDDQHVSLLGSLVQRGVAHFGGGVDRGLVLQQEASHVVLAKVASGVQGGVPSLKARHDEFGCNAFTAV